MGLVCSKNKRKIHPLEVNNSLDVDKVKKLRRTKTIYSYSEYNNCVQCPTDTDFNSNSTFVKIKVKKK